MSFRAAFHAAFPNWGAYNTSEKSNDTPIKKKIVMPAPPSEWVQSSRCNWLFYDWHYKKWFWSIEAPMLLAGAFVLNPPAWEDLPEWANWMVYDRSLHRWKVYKEEPKYSIDDNVWHASGPMTLTDIGIKTTDEAYYKLEGILVLNSALYRRGQNEH